MLLRALERHPELLRRRAAQLELKAAAADAAAPPPSSPAALGTAVCTGTGANVAREDDRRFVALAVVHQREIDVAQPQAALPDHIVGREEVLVPHLCAATTGRAAITHGSAVGLPWFASVLVPRLYADTPVRTYAFASASPCHDCRAHVDPPHPFIERVCGLAMDMDGSSGERLGRRDGISSIDSSHAPLDRAR